jgi:hypothetical protein
MNLPFKIDKDHKCKMRYYWKSKGILFNDEKHFLETWLKYVSASSCEICKKKFKDSLDRHLEHNHTNGKIRHICCRSCNMLKYDVKTKGQILERGVTKYFDSRRQIYIYQFRVKKKIIKQSINLEKLMKFVKEYKSKNDCYT